MKTYIYKSVFWSLLCVTLLSCKKDFLNIVPQGQKVAVTTNDYNLLMNNAGLALFTFAGGWQAPMLMGDDIAAEFSQYNSSSTQPRTQAAFRWDDEITKAGDIDFGIRGWLSNLYTLNKVINEVMNATGGTEQQKRSILAEAKANRAWIYFQFINFYGKPYTAATAGTDPGFPIILTADITVTSFDRGTVQSVYDFIVKDFTGAIADLPPSNVNGIRFNKAAAEGLLGKVYLFMGKNTEALAQFNAAFRDNAAREVPARLYDYNKEFGPGGKFIPISYNGPSNSPGNNNYDFTESLVSKSYYNSSYNGNGFSNDAFVLAPAARGLFMPSDLRLNFYAPVFPFQVPNPSGRLRKYGVQYSQFGLQISELYLLRAEAKARLNDLQGAKTDVKTLRESRMPIGDADVPNADAVNEASMVKYIFDERSREFAMEGYRWFDMRRESTDPIFASKTYTHTLYNSNNTTTLYTLRPVRLTMRLPYAIAIANPNLSDNP